MTTDQETDRETDEAYTKRVEKHMRDALGELCACATEGLPVTISLIDRLSFGAGYLMGNASALNARTKAYEAEIDRLHDMLKRRIPKVRFEGRGKIPPLSTAEE